MADLAKMTELDRKLAKPAMRIGKAIGQMAAGTVLAVGFSLVAGCEKPDLPPEQVAVDVMTRCVKGQYDGLDARVTGEVANFVARDGEMRKKGRGWFVSIKKASFEVVDVKVEDDSASVRLKAVLDGRQEEMPVRLERSKDRKWQVSSFNDNKQEVHK